ncbi:MAG: hypothetical protein RL037_828 [Bacteroidota bacterium]
MPRIVSNTDDYTLCHIKIKRMSCLHYSIKNFVCDKLQGNWYNSSAKSIKQTPIFIKNKRILRMFSYCPKHQKSRTTYLAYHVSRFILIAYTFKETQINSLFQIPACCCRRYVFEYIHVILSAKLFLAKT